MVAENILLHHWESELACLKENIHSYTIPDTEMTHKIRVGIKKLRAYFKLYLFIYKKDETKELFKDTEDLFSLLGKHRNIQINKEKAEVYLKTDHQPYLKWLENKQQALPQISDAIHSYSFTNIDRLTEIMKCDLGEADNKLFIKHILKINRRLSRKTEGRMAHFKRNSHRIRKDLKQIFYLSRMIAPETYVPAKSLKRLEKVLDTLGNIQDDEESLSLMKDYEQASPEFYKQSVIHSEQGIEKRKQHQLDKAHHKVRQYLRSN